mmetsp:Transcript_13180/g.27260  ORF Transcript_13180/g.27260 Transcript_13180/m.27260 type:complete len:122 (+) Transcript_13180:531-896(+)
MLLKKHSTKTISVIASKMSLGVLVLATALACIQNQGSNSRIVMNQNTMKKTIIDIAIRRPKKIAIDEKVGTARLVESDHPTFAATGTFNEIRFECLRFLISMAMSLETCFPAYFDYIRNLN